MEEIRKQLVKDMKAKYPRALLDEFDVELIVDAFLMLDKDEKDVVPVKALLEIIQSSN